MQIKQFTTTTTTTTTAAAAVATTSINTVQLPLSHLLQLATTTATSITFLPSNSVTISADSGDVAKQSKCIPAFLKY